MDHSVEAVIAALLIAIGPMGCATARPLSQHALASDMGVPRCSEEAANDLLSVCALQCWFDAPHGRWRTLSHESHFAVLVVHVEAAHIRDADIIARRFVEREHDSFSEILIYAQPESATGAAKIRRVSWTRAEGFEALEFVASPEH